MYYYAQTLCGQASYLGVYLRSLESTDTRFIPGGTGSEPNNATPAGLTDWEYGAGDTDNILDVYVNLADTDNRGLRKDGMIGFFKDDNGNLHFMLTNVYHGSELSADDATLGFVIEFDDDINSLTKYTRWGTTQTVTLTNHTLVTTLPGGTGDLYKF